MRAKVSWRWIAIASAAALVATMPAGNAAKLQRHTWEKPHLVSDVLAHRETSLAIDPTNTNHLFLCDPSGVPNTPYFHASTDGGRHWSYMRVESSLTDTRTYAFEGGDCDVAFDQGGTMYSADTWLGDLSIGHSRDQGRTWAGTAVATTSPIVDRPWLVGGPAGTLYATYQDLQCCTPSAIWFIKSTNYGSSFSPAVPVTTFAPQAPSSEPNGPDGAYTWEGNFVVDKSGQNLYLVYTRRAAPDLTGSSGPETVWVAASHDGGTTWTSHLVTSTPGPASYLYPSIAMDGAGGLHVVYSSAGKKDHPIWYSYSTDKAAHWSDPKPVLSGVAGYSPWIAGGADAGEAAVAWYGSPDPKATDTTKSQWFFYTARISHSGRSLSITDAGPTTSKPIFTGRQYIPEFEMVRLDPQDNIHIGMSAYRTENHKTAWAAYYQRQSAP
jgi:hypothetical protein